MFNCIFVAIVSERIFDTKYCRIFYGIKVLLADWKVKTPCNANGVFINKTKFNVKLKPKKILNLLVENYLLAHYIVTFRNSRSTSA